MKHPITVLLFLLISVGVFAQPIINKAFEPKDGENYYTRGLVYESSSMLWKNGPNQYWEFPYFNTYDYTEYINYTSIDAAAFDKSFAMATHYRKTRDTVGESTILYYFSSSDSFCYLGYKALTTTYNITARWKDPEVDIKYPITFNDSFEDIGYFFFLGRDNDGSDSSTSYSTKFTKTVADGYGKMLFRNAIIDSVVRLRITSTRINKVYFGYDTFLYQNDTVNETRLVWVSNKYNRPIATVVLAAPYGKNYVRTAFYYNSNTYLGDENPSETEQIQCFPNPANDIIKIQGIKNLASVEIKDLTGKSLGKLTNDFDQIPVAHLPIGMYLLYATNEQGDMAIIKFIKN